MTIKLIETKVLSLLSDYDDMRELCSNAELGPVPEQVKIEDLMTEELPPWYKFISFEEAEVSFDDRQDGVLVNLKDCTTKAMFILKRHTKTDDEGNIELTLEAASSYCQHHVKSIDGENRAKIFPTDIPPADAKNATWNDWTSSVREKNLMRLVRGIMLFRRNAGEEGNE